MKQQYQTQNFSSERLELIAYIDRICVSYMADGYTLTARQLYYQLVARNIIPNNERSYKNTTKLLSDARLAGYIDWDAIEDRTRGFITRPRWGTGKQFINSVMPQYHTDLWRNQDMRVFVIVEKEALAGVLERVCKEFDVPLLAARGYPSVSTLREFADDQIIHHAREGQNIKILHLGDHDPSGIDMTRDLEDRLNLLCGDDAEYFSIDRLALNMDQIEEHGFPPNPAKITDTRAKAYIKEHGTASWELDAMEPRLINELVRENISLHIDDNQWDEDVARIARTKNWLLSKADEIPDEL